MMKQDFLVIENFAYLPHTPRTNGHRPKIKVRSSQKQHALNQRSPTEDKGQKLTEVARP